MLLLPNDIISDIGFTEQYRVGCDLMNLFFVFDEKSDLVDAEEARKQADIIMDALRNPGRPRPENECIVGEVARQ